MTYWGEGRSEDVDLQEGQELRAACLCLLATLLTTFCTSPGLDSRKPSWNSQLASPLCPQWCVDSSLSSLTPETILHGSLGPAGTMLVGAWDMFETLNWPKERKTCINP